MTAVHLRSPKISPARDPALLREGYEGPALLVWSIPLDGGGCMVFESERAAPDELRPLLAVELGDDAREAPCPRCGATDWTVCAHADDPA